MIKIIRMKKLVLILLVIVGMTSCDYYNESSEVITVTHKERVAKSESSVYMVFAEEGEFKVTDRIFSGEFDSSKIYGKIQVGKKYRIKTTGYRMPFWSSYKNINSAVEVK